MKFFELLFILTVLPVLSTATASNFPQPKDNEERIIAGSPAEEGQFPWHVMLRRSFYGKPMCGGSLISTQWVLTAAHCVERRDEIYLTMGTSKWDSQTAVSKTVLSKYLYIHSAYDEKLYSYDIALVKMPIPMRLNKFIQIIPLPLPTMAYEDLLGKKAIAVGFGLTNDSAARNIPDNLMFVEASIISNDNCSLVYGREIPGYSLCFKGSGKQSTCKGDSGGSLVLRGENGEYVLIGVTSFGAKKCEWPWPSVFVRVTAFIEWIQSAGLDS